MLFHQKVPARKFAKYELDVYGSELATMKEAKVSDKHKSVGLQS